jgi:hypothetical protein
MRNGDLHVMTLAPELEHELLTSVRPAEGRVACLVRWRSWTAS